MTLVAVIVVTLALAVYLIAPLFSSEGGGEGALDTEDARLELATRQASVYATLKELDFDLATGKLSEADHKELSERYSAEAVEILEKMDSLTPPGPGGSRRRSS